MKTTNAPANCGNCRNGTEKTTEGVTTILCSETQKHEFIKGGGQCRMEALPSFTCFRHQAGGAK